MLANGTIEGNNDPRDIGLEPFSSFQRVERYGKPRQTKAVISRTEDTPGDRRGSRGPKCSTVIDFGMDGWPLPIPVD
jgi:hypothetical protein